MENPDGTVRLATENEIDRYDKTQQVWAHFWEYIELRSKIIDPQEIFVFNFQMILFICFSSHRFGQRLYN